MVRMVIQFNRFHFLAGVGKSWHSSWQAWIECIVDRLFWCREITGIADRYYDVSFFELFLCRRTHRHGNSLDIARCRRRMHLTRTAPVGGSAGVFILATGCWGFRQTTR